MASGGIRRPQVVHTKNIETRGGRKLRLPRKKRRGSYLRQGPFLSAPLPQNHGAMRETCAPHVIREIRRGQKPSRTPHLTQSPTRALEGVLAYPPNHGARRGLPNETINEQPIVEIFRATLSPTTEPGNRLTKSDEKSWEIRDDHEEGSSTR